MPEKKSEEVQLRGDGTDQHKLELLRLSRKEMLSVSGIRPEEGNSCPKPSLNQPKMPPGSLRNSYSWLGCRYLLKYLAQKCEVGSRLVITQSDWIKGGDPSGERERMEPL